MMTKPIAVFAVLLTVAGMVVYCTFETAAQQTRPEKQESVRAADIGKTVQLIGRLGKPMAEPVDIVGHWERLVFGAKPGSTLVFVVTSVDGKPLDHPVEFYRVVVRIDGARIRDQDVALDETWRCKAIESGQFCNLMHKHWELFYDAPASPRDYGDGPFVSEINLSKRTLVRKGQTKQVQTKQ